jgi:hypothetical protein
LTWSTLATEWVGFWLILSPLYTKQARAIAVCVLPGLHAGFALGLNLGGFSLAMISFYPLLLGAEHWDWLEKRFGPRLRPLSERVQAKLEPLLPRLTPPAPAWSHPMWGWLKNGGMAMLLVAITFEVLNDNAPVPKALRLPQPAWTKLFIEYPRVLQGWRMFAKDPPQRDGMIYVDAITAGGEHVDPYNQVASDQPMPFGDVVPRHMGQSQYFVMYTDRIAERGYAAYRQAFSEWLQGYPKRTGRAEDCLVSYEVFFVSDQSPPLGQTKPTPIERTRFMNFTAPREECAPLRPASRGPAVSVKGR